MYKRNKRKEKKKRKRKEKRKTKEKKKKEKEKKKKKRKRKVSSVGENFAEDRENVIGLVGHLVEWLDGFVPTPRDPGAVRSDCTPGSLGPKAGVPRLEATAAELREDPQGLKVC
jgi:outer membrane biosynthesis protein TonB